MNEPYAHSYRERIADDNVRLIFTATLVDAAMVIERRFCKHGGGNLDLSLHKAEVEVIAVAANQARRALAPIQQWLRSCRFKLRGFISYTLAALSGEPLLFNGNDFAQTNIEAA